MIDPLTLLALIGGIALATYFFEIQIRNSMLARSFPWPFNPGWVFYGRNLFIALYYNYSTYRSMIHGYIHYVFKK